MFTFAKEIFDGKHFLCSNTCSDVYGLKCLAFQCGFFAFVSGKWKMKSLVDINYSPGTGKLYLVRQKLLFVQHKKNWNISNLKNMLIAWKVSKYGVFSDPHFPVFGMNTERYEVSPYSVRIRENTDQKKLDKLV